jgi:hypothetical protein
VNGGRATRGRMIVSGSRWRRGRWCFLQFGRFRVAAEADAAFGASVLAGAQVVSAFDTEAAKASASRGINWPEQLPRNGRCDDEQEPVRHRDYVNAPEFPISVPRVL